MNQITFTFSQVLSLLERQRELASQDAWKLYREAVEDEDGRQLKKWQFFEELPAKMREPEDITTLKKYITNDQGK